MKKKDLSFEDALKRLEEIVEALENSSGGIESALEKYEEGIKLYKYCYNKLNEMQGRIEVLFKDNTNGLVKREFEINGNAG